MKRNGLTKMANADKNRQNVFVFAESPEAVNKDFGTRPVHKSPFKVMVFFARKKLHLIRIFTSKIYYQ